MKTHSLPFTALLLLAAAVASSAASSPAPLSPEAAASLIADVASGQALFFDLEPAFGAIAARPQSIAQGKIDTALRSSGGYTLRLSGERSGSLVCLEFRLSRGDRKAFKTISYGIAVNTAQISLLKDVKFYQDGGDRTGPGRQPPMICVNDAEGRSTIVLGFIDQVEITEIRRSGDTMRLARPAQWETITAKEIRDGVYLDLCGDYWFDALGRYAAYADEYRKFKPRPIPAQAYEPVWCSWYTLTTGVNEKNIWENAVIAKSLGFGTILIDAGWDTPGRTCMDENSTYGDRFAYRGKFPDLAGLIDRIHKELGMAVELWASPWSISKKSRAQREIQDVRIRIGKNQNPGFFLCARCAKSGDFLAKNLSDVFRYYNVDGMWWDFLDSVTMVECRGHDHDYQTYGQGYNANMTKIMDAVRKVNPNALIEIRLNSSNINNKLFANVLETYDTPLNYPDNRGLLVYVRTLVNGCVPKTDPTMWVRSRDEGKLVPEDDLVGRYMATMITVGVPAVSQDFTKMPESNKQVIKAYLDFYHAHKTDLAKADFRPVGNGENYPNYVLEGRKAAYLYSATETMPRVELKHPTETLYLFSGWGKPKIAFDIGGLRPGKYEWTARDSHFREVEKGTLAVGEKYLTWDAPVPSGGTVEMRFTAG